MSSEMFETNYAQRAATSQGFAQPKDRFDALGVGREEEDSWFADVGAAAVAGAMRENSISTGIRLSTGSYDGEVPDEFGNPIDLIESKLGEEWVRENLDDIEAGMYDDVSSLHQIYTREAQLKDEKELLESMDRSTLGSFVGALVGAVADPTSWVSVGGVAIKGARLARLVQMGASGLISAAAQETVLHSMQKYRTLEESLLSVTASAAIGGTLGAVVAKSKVDPAMTTGNRGDTNLRVIGEEGIIRQEVNRTGDDSVGAARADTRRLMADDVTIDGAVVNTVSKGLAKVGRSIVHRAFQLKNKDAAGVLFQIMGNSGIITKGAKAGRAQGETAEELRQLFMVPVNRMFFDMDKDVRNLSKDLGFKFHQIQKRVQLYGDLFDLTRKMSRKLDIEETKAQLISRYGDEGYRKIEGLSSAMNGRIQETNKIFTHKMKELGFVRDEDLLKRLEDERAGLKLQRELGKRQGATKEQLDEIRGQIEEKSKQINKELQKAPDLGDEYGIAQVWDRVALEQNPQATKALLREIMLKTPDEDWLEEFYDGMTPAQFEALRGTAKGDEILEEWAGDAHLHREETAKARLEAAEAAANESSTDLDNVLRALKIVKKNEHSLTRKDIRLRRDAFHAKVNALKATRDEIAETRRELNKLNRAETAGQRRVQSADDRAFKDAATAARRETLERQKQTNDVEPEAGAAQFNRLQSLKSKAEATSGKLEEAQAKLDADSYGQPNASAVDEIRLSAAVSLEKRLEELESKFNTLQKELEEGVETPQVKEVEETPQLAKDRERARASADEALRVEKTEQVNLESLVKRSEASLERMQRAVQRAEERARLVDGHLRDVQTKLKLKKMAKESLTEIRKAMKERAAKDAKEARAAGRAVKAATKMTPLDEYVQKTYDKLVQGQRLDNSDATDLAPITGRLKQRVLHMTPEQRAKAEQMGLLETDIRRILQSQYDELSGDLAMHEALDVGVGRSYETMQDAFDALGRDYDARIAEAGDGSDEAVAMAAEKLEAQDMFKLLRERILRRDSLDPKHPWLAWTSAKFRQLNLMRYGVAFGISSLTDMGTVALNNPVLFSAKLWGPAIRNLKGSPRDELLEIVHATEIAMHDMASPSRGVLSRLGEDDLFNTMNPIHDKSSMMGKAFGVVDRSMAFGSTLSTVAGGMHHWTRMMKSYATVAFQYQLEKFVKKGWDNLSDYQKATLTSVGIGKRELDAVTADLTAHSTRSSKGYLELNTENWSPEARNIVRKAAVRHVNRSVTTPGVGDTNMMMSNSVGKFFMQFWSHPFAFTNRFILPAMQRGAMGDPAVAHAMLWMAAAGTAVSMLKMTIKGEDPLESIQNDPSAFVREMITRTGILGIYDQFFWSALTTAGVESPSKYQERNAFTMLTGVNVSTAADMLSTLDSIGAGEYSEAAEKGARLMPLQMFRQVYENYFTD